MSKSGKNMQLLAPNLPVWFYSWFYCQYNLWGAGHNTKYNPAHIEYLFLPEILRQDNLVPEFSKKIEELKWEGRGYENTVTKGQLLCLCFLFYILIMFHSYQENTKSR